jgi:glutathione synthase/RimK-type ligase-like ATP-grasp enzyme
MKIAIHKSNSGFHPRWVSYCEKKKIPYKRVNCFDNDLVEQLKDCDALMWHHSQNDPGHLILAKSLLFSLEQAGIVVFPDFYTNWHFDDKLGQKYLLEALGLPLVKTTIFYNKKDALEWAMNTTFPVVFKLRRGAGSFNVKLIKTFSEAKLVILKSFGRGFSNFNALSYFVETLRKFRLRKANLAALLKSLTYFIIKPAYERIAGNEVGYVYFQEFIPKNNFDIRVIVIGDKAFAIKRMVRDNDFRASGSGNIKYEKENFNDSTIKLSFDLYQKLKSQCVAFDFIYKNDKPFLVEISYGFVKEGYDNCVGYWDKDLVFIPGKFDPCSWMVDEVINEIMKKYV